MQKGMIYPLQENEIVGLLSRLIIAKSINPPGKEEIAAQVLSDFFKTVGLKPTFDYVEKERPNILCKVPGKSHEKSFLLTSHLDVVPPGDLSLWNHDPFEASVAEGKIYGRGACDAKGSVAAMAAALVALSAIADELNGDVLFLGVAGEEKGGVGSKKAITTELRADAAIVGEPTNLNIAIGQKGRLGIKIEVLAESSHPACSGENMNSITSMMKVVSFIENYLVQKMTVDSNESGFLVINGIHAGEPGVLSAPNKCSLDLSLWFPSEETHETAIENFDNYVKTLARRNNINLKIYYHKGASSYLIPETEHIVQLAGKIIKQVRGSEPEIQKSYASCDMYIFGSAGIPTIICGPGDLRMAHSANEYVQIEEVLTASRIYFEIARSFLQGN